VETGISSSPMFIKVNTLPLTLAVNAAMSIVLKPKYDYSYSAQQ